MSVYPNDLASSCCLDVFITIEYMWSSHAMTISKRIEFALSPFEGLELGLKKITGWTIRILGQSSGGGLS